jgi:gluconate 5-dehydrogenase
MPGDRLFRMSILESFQLNGRRALITGSSGGIGLALARALGQAGAHVVLNGRNADKLAQAAALLQAEQLSVSTCAFDVTQAGEVRTAIDALDAQGAIDILINNAGMQIRGPLHEFVDEDWHTLMKTNLDSVSFVSKAVAQKMIPRILNQRAAAQMPMRRSPTHNLNSFLVATNLEPM